MLRTLKSKFTRILMPYKKGVRWFSYLINLASIMVLAFWLFSRSSAIDFEPWFVLATVVYATVNLLLKWLLDESEFSPAYALAAGYVSNFIEPVVTQLLENGEKNVTIYIYKPYYFDELFKSNVDRVKAAIRNKEFELNEFNLELKHARARDILLIQRSKTKKVYFDFPNTLTSLISYVDYKVGSKSDSSSEKAKEKLTSELIEKFYQKVDELLAKKDLTSFIKYCDKNVNLDF